MILVLLAAQASLEAGAKATEEFRVEDAVVLLERAKGEGPYRHADHVRLYEQLGIALAYAGRTDDAIAAFDRMLGLDPSHALRYTLSPKATLVFERARELAAARPTPAIDLGLPRGKMVGDPLPIDVDVLADPHGTFARAILHVRIQPGGRNSAGPGPAKPVHPTSLAFGSLRAPLAKSPREGLTIEALSQRTGRFEQDPAADGIGSTWTERVIALDEPSGRHRVVLDPIGGDREIAVGVHLTVTDAAGSEVLAVGTRDHPREIVLGYTPPTPWYERWWIWTIASAVVVAGASTAIALSVRKDDPTIDARARWE
jgi:hypothetical protein